MCFTGFYLILLDFTRINWFFSEFYWAFFGLSGFYHILLGFTRFYYFSGYYRPLNLLIFLIWLGFAVFIRLLIAYSDLTGLTLWYQVLVDLTHMTITSLYFTFFRFYQFLSFLQVKCVTSEWVLSRWLDLIRFPLVLPVSGFGWFDSHHNHFTLHHLFSRFYQFLSFFYKSYVLQVNGFYRVNWIWYGFTWFYRISLIFLGFWFHWLLNRFHWFSGILIDSIHIAMCFGASPSLSTSLWAFPLLFFTTGFYQFHGFYRVLLDLIRVYCILRGSCFLFKIWSGFIVI